MRGPRRTRAAGPRRSLGRPGGAVRRGSRRDPRGLRAHPREVRCRLGAAKALQGLFPLGRRIVRRQTCSTVRSSASGSAGAMTWQTWRRRRGVGERSRSFGPPRPTRRDFCRPEAVAPPNRDAPSSASRFAEATSWQPGARGRGGRRTLDEHVAAAATARRLLPPPSRCSTKAGDVLSSGASRAGDRTSAPPPSPRRRRHPRAPARSPGGDSRGRSSRVPWRRR